MVLVQKWHFSQLFRDHGCELAWCDLETIEPSILLDERENEFYSRVEQIDFFNAVFQKSPVFRTFLTDLILF